MTSICRCSGRGRGWSSAENQEQALRRPGESVSQKKASQNDFTTLFNKIRNTDFDESYESRVEEIVQLVSDMMQRESIMEIIFNLYQYALNNKDIQQKIMLLYNNKSFKQLSNGNYSAFSAFFVPMQEDFNRRYELRQESVENFRNVVTLFCTTYGRVKAKSNSNYGNLLDKPFLNYMQMLLETATLEDIEIVAEQLPNNGKTLLERCETGMKQLLITARETLITKDLCRTSRTLLLYILDVENHGFNKLPRHLHKFYVSQLPNASFLNDADPPKNIGSDTENERVEQTEVAQQRSHTSKRNGVPRAIRGSGANQHTKDRGETHKKSFNTKSSVPEHNKAWEHDDRFDTSYGSD